jgi:cytosine/uracil/thiamine/allantoin permease
MSIDQAYAGMMCYFLYWLLQFPLMFVSPQKIRHLFTAKSIIVPFAWAAILIWAMIRAPPRISLAPKHTSLSGSALSWAWLSALNSSLGFYATVAVNIPDFTVSGGPLLLGEGLMCFQRYAKNERACVGCVGERHREKLMIF